MVMPVTEEVFLGWKNGSTTGEFFFMGFGGLSGILRFSWILNGLEMDFVSKNEGSSREKV